MSLTLSSSDLEKLSHAIQLLVSPLNHSAVDGWRAAVNRQLRDLLYADSAGFLLPVESGLAMYSDEHDPKALAVFPEVQPPRLPDGRTVWEEGVRAGVTSIATMYGRTYDLFHRSAYYNEYAAVNGAHDTIGATVSLSKTDVDGVASLHFWHARPEGRRFGDRELTLLRLLFPAFRAGVETQVRWNVQRTDLLRSLDTLGQAVMVVDRTGRTVHQTPTLTAMMSEDPDASTLAVEVRVTMNAVRSATVSRQSHANTPECACVREVRTAKAHYVVRGTLYGGGGVGCSGYVLIALERLSRVRRPDQELREAFGLTRAEIRVAILLSEGRPNAEIARELGVTAHTTRRHTERVLQKMGIHSRAQVGTRMYF